MRLVFMGTPQFAVPSLLALHRHHDVVAAFSQPDRPSGRGRKVTASSVKIAAGSLDVAVHQPPTLRTPESLALLTDLAPDCIVVAAYGAILPKEILAIPRLGCINVHASLLPRWRGAAPIQRAILAGDAVTGVSIMRMEEGLDTGPWCAQVEVPVDGKYAADLTAELAAAGASALIAALAEVFAGTVTWHAQDDALATYAAKLSAADVTLDPSLTVLDSLARVRASGSSAPCRVTVGDRNLTVLRAERADLPLDAGSAACYRDLVLGCSDGTIRLTSVIPEGRGAMGGPDFARGARLGLCEWSAR